MSIQELALSRVSRTRGDGLARVLKLVAASPPRQMAWQHVAALGIFWCLVFKNGHRNTYQIPLRNCICQLCRLNEYNRLDRRAGLQEQYCNQRSISWQLSTGYLLATENSSIHLINIERKNIHQKKTRKPHQTSSMVFSPRSTPFSHLPLSSNSSPSPPFSLPRLASFALCTAPFFRASRGPRSASRSATARFFSGRERFRAAIWRSTSASSCSFLESNDNVGCSGRLSDGFADFGSCEARRIAIVDSRCEISSGSAASCAV